jgi:hypothetical protein
MAKTPAVSVSALNFRDIEKAVGKPKLHTGPGAVWIRHDGRALCVNLDELIDVLIDRPVRVTITKKGRDALAAELNKKLAVRR